MISQIYIKIKPELFCLFFCYNWCRFIKFITLFPNRKYTFMNRFSNLISTTIEQKELVEILKAISLIDEKLSQLVSLSEEELANLPKMKSNTTSFVQQCVDLAKKYPEVVPKDVDIREIEKDLKLIKSIAKIREPLLKVVKKLDDSALLAGSEAYQPCTAIHNSVMARQVGRSRSQRSRVTA